ncbi:hypothetical protein ASG11_03245 [Sphingomonas sp. Leaf357]|nr:hypothetical protein ASG11_03245 [Sphingomonas sp. Leaf357]
MTIKGDLQVQPGATIDIASGRTLTLLGGLLAPIASIFTGGGTVDLNRSRIACAHPEWWGAVPGDAASDSLPALRACLRAHPALRLLAADYYISDTFVVDRPFCCIEGSGFRGTGPRQGTRIIVTSGTADVMRAGPAAAPAMVNDFCQNVSIRSIALNRSLPVDVAGARLPAGLRAQFLLFADFQQVSAFEHGVGFAICGLVRSTLNDCVAFRSLPGRQTMQRYHGFLLDGSRDIGLAGGNASLFMRNCNATIGGTPAVADAIGLLLEGAFADTFVTDFETAGVATGIRIDGQSAAIGARARHGHINLHIHMPIIDQCGQVGIDVLDVAPQGLIDISDPYVAVAPGAEAALRFRQMRGAASVTGGQLAGTMNTNARGQAIGVAAIASRGLQVSGLKILEHARPGAFAQCSGFRLELTIGNPDSRVGGSGVMLRDCDHGTVKISLSGQENAFASGIALVGSAKGLHINTIGIDAATIGGSANRVTLGGRSLPVPSRTTDLIVEGL